MTIHEFIEEYERMCRITQFDPPQEKLGLEDLRELQEMVIHMFNDNCGEVPNFELEDNGRKIKLLTNVSNEDN